MNIVNSAAGRTISAEGDSAVELGSTIELGILAQGFAELTLDELAHMRRHPPPVFASRLSAQLLKHSDEQTLASLAALEQALAAGPLGAGDCERWSVLSAARYFGRGASASVIDRYRSEGPWGVSVHITPHGSPHAAASTVSLGLAAHGPCIGVGDGADNELGALVTAGCLLLKGRCDGCWVIVSGWSPELEVEVNGRPKPNSVCRAIALGLVLGVTSECSGDVRIRPVARAEASAADRDPKPELSILDPMPEIHNPLRFDWRNSMRIEVDLGPSLCGGRTCQARTAAPPASPAAVIASGIRPHFSPVERV